MILSSEFEYMKSGKVVHMYAETIDGDQYILGTFRPAQDGYYYFEPVNGAVLSCKMLREAAKAVSELNTGNNIERTVMDRLSEKLRQNNDCGDFGEALEGYAEMAQALEQEVERLKIEKDRLHSHRKAKRAFWSGFERSRCQPDDNDIQANWYQFLDKESD